MKIFRRIFGRPARRHSSRFESHYSGIVRSGTGYPTADEARRDLSAYDRNSLPFGWPH